MPRVRVNGIDLHYERTGSGPPLLLIMGLAGQLTDWPESFVEDLSRHFDVIFFDNRDVGLSTWVDAPAPTRLEIFRSFARRSTATPSYALDDLADDSAALLGALGLERAHVVGMSMGGMIAQLMALRHRERVASLCSMMSSTGNLRVGRPSLATIAHIARRRDPTRETVVEDTVAFFRVISGADWDEHEQRSRTALSIERAFNPIGAMRQLHAIAAAPDRTPVLEKISAPTIVIHGLDDGLINPSGGTATARAIAGSRLVMVPGMGHDLPATRHVEIVEAIVSNARRSEAVREPG